MNCRLLACWLLLAGFATAADRPNVLFLLSDDQRPDAVGAYGNEHIVTPNIDGLVQQGFNFRNAYCMGSNGGAVCLPSRAMINSGRTLYHVPMDLDGVPTMPQTFRDSGYVTFGTGKWHNRQPSFARSFSAGKAVMFGGMSNHLEVPVVDLAEDGQFVNKRTGDAFSSDLFADAAIEFLDSDPEEPFFCYVAFTAPHDPRMPPAEALEPYEPSELPLPENFLPQHPFFNGWMTGRDEVLAPWPRTAPVIRDQLAEYYGMITHMDWQIGRILEALEATGEADNTLIVFTSDHGLAVGSHGLLGKQSVYEHSMGAPLLFAGPDIKHGESDALVYLMDIFPTLCELAEVDAPGELDGKSLAGIIEGEQESVRDAIFLSYEDVQRAVRRGDWKLIRYPHINKTQLFYLADDPHEMHDLSAKPAQQDRVAELTALLESLQEQVGDDAELSSDDPVSEEIDLSGRKRTADRWQPEWIIKKYFD